MKIGYFGSPELSAALLTALLNSGEHEVLFVVSNPDKPKGRSGRPVPTPVSDVALEHGLPLYRYPTLKDPAVAGELSSYGADLFFVFAYGRLLPGSVFRLPPRGTVNLHASLLPLLRGASPIQSALLEGFATTGWSLQFIAEALDAGDLIASVELPVAPDETAGELMERMLPHGIDLSLRVLSDFDSYAGRAIPQNHEKATHCSKFTVEMSKIRWSDPSQQIHNRIRAMNPSPVARTTLNGQSLKIYRSHIPDPGDLPEIQEGLTGQKISPREPFTGSGEKKLMQGPPGRLLAIGQGKRKGLYVLTGDGPLEILELQPENKRVMNARDFLNGYRLQGDEILE